MKNKKTIIINLLGGPGSGKSTTAAGLFYRLKMDGYDCELITEFAKCRTWEQNSTALNDQFFMTASQNYKQTILLGKVDVMITDSPILIGLLYYKEQNKIIRDSFETFVVETFKAQNNINFFIDRRKVYNPNGRNQTEAEAKEIDKNNLDLLIKHNISYTTIPGTPDGLEQMYRYVELELNKRKHKETL